jgi:hypothetical protein
MKNLGKVFALGMVGAVVLTGCSIASTDPQHVALHYTDGPFSDKKFEYCVGSGTRDTGGAADDNFYYPSGQRTFTFSKAQGSDSGPLDVNTAGGQIQLIQEGQITFTLNTDCTEYKDAQGKVWPGGRLQKFHETIGAKMNAYTEDEDKDAGDGWGKFLNEYIGAVINKAVDNEGQKYQWMDLYGKADVRGQWEKDVKGTIPSLVKAQLGDDLIVVNNVQLQTPQVPDGIKQEMQNQQAAVLRNKTSELDKQNAQQFSSFQEYLNYQQALAVNEAIKSGKANINITSPGQSVIVGPK